ncbi:uncharacterized protein LOC5509179 isoform X2 [Nematostella vectensis]|uniref:uncharacterized protein LOC5509179 isoform X2 n=1 Tax=Nematostella vectensis TaxID=45351 RepID=UPI00138FB00B|nr:uncharacterized protein LOC5509179 isoform X2 [Nematostella vectensis]
MPRERKLPARLRDSATSEDIEAAEGESSGSASDSPHLKHMRKGSTSSSSDLASPIDRMATNPAMNTAQPTMQAMAQYNLNHAMGQTSDYNSGASSEPIYPCGICQKET